MELTACPECGVPAVIEQRHVLASTDGPVEHAKVRCAQGHGFLMPVAGLAAVRAATGARPAA